MVSLFTSCFYSFSLANEQIWIYIVTTDNSPYALTTWRFLPMRHSDDSKLAAPLSPAVTQFSRPFRNAPLNPANFLSSPIRWPRGSRANLAKLNPRPTGLTIHNLPRNVRLFPFPRSIIRLNRGRPQKRISGRLRTYFKSPIYFVLTYLDFRRGSCKAAH